MLYLCCFPVSLPTCIPTYLWPYVCSFISCMMFVIPLYVWSSALSSQKLLCVCYVCQISLATTSSYTTTMHYHHHHQCHHHHHSNSCLPFIIATFLHIYIRFFLLHQFCCIMCISHDIKIINKQQKNLLVCLFGLYPKIEAEMYYCMGH